MLTVNKVNITADLKIAKVYISFLENKKSIEEVMDIIKCKHNLIRHHVGLNLTLKYIPQLRFYYDDTFEYSQRIYNIIDKIHTDD